MVQIKLTPISFHHISKSKHYFWLYRCECGRQKVISKNDVPFYKKLGYNIEDDSFEKVGLVHYRIIKHLPHD
jgi:hypothetical protein